MGFDRTVQSHVGQDGWTGLSNIALDNPVRCCVGQAHQMGFFQWCGFPTLLALQMRA
ncbi:hypothetical protein PCANC_00336 [Puccinia coronata f. sp. avenae]|uniref:Uncharacterized protein n=1 Tax=Puccinia coronata f. sp. avenae TaxID=200324 RepID=A0A2N5W970_9BASI|nr:hypothetical protein PCANC_00336 [Puccinia coronata f. sp. avenae]